MPKKKRSTEEKIVQAAWKLFYKKGYEATTVDEIIAASATSKGTFYHYFRSKDALLNTLSVVFDDAYREIASEIDPALSAREKLLYANRKLMGLIEAQIDLPLLASLYSTQLVTEERRSLLDSRRYYFSWVQETISAGLKSGEFSSDFALYELVHLFTMFERSLIYDWILYGGTYSLADYNAHLLPMLLERFTNGKGKTIPEAPLSGQPA